MTKTLSKWEWIARECLKLGYRQSAEDTQAIEDALKALYGDTMTKNKIAWILFQIKAAMSTVTSSTIAKIARSASFCIACERTLEGDCTGCLFQKKFGGCNTDPSSLYHKFFDSLSYDELVFNTLFGRL